MKWILGTENIADGFTKALPGPAFADFVDTLGLTVCPCDSKDSRNSKIEQNSGG
jgi:hypothetical protein